MQNASYDPILLLAKPEVLASSPIRARWDPDPCIPSILFLSPLKCQDSAVIKSSPTLQPSASSACSLFSRQGFLPGEHGLILGHEYWECLLLLLLPGDVAICWDFASHEPVPSTQSPLGVIPAAVTCYPQTPWVPFPCLCIGTPPAFSPTASTLKTPCRLLKLSFCGCGQLEMPGNLYPFGAIPDQ